MQSFVSDMNKTSEFSLATSQSVSNLYLNNIYVGMNNRKRIQGYKKHYLLGLFRGLF